jgi:hypothetical protein
MPGPATTGFCVTVLEIVVNVPEVVIDMPGPDCRMPPVFTESSSILMMACSVV